MLKNLTYTKDSGESSERVVISLKEPSDKLLALDVTEFTDEERRVYAEAVAELSEMFVAGIEDLGLKSQYRYFKQKGIQYAEE